MTELIMLLALAAIGFVLYYFFKMLFKIFAIIISIGAAFLIMGYLGFHPEQYLSSDINFQEMIEKGIETLSPYVSDLKDKALELLEDNKNLNI